MIKFSSTEAALQHLADLTGKRVKIASDYDSDMVLLIVVDDEKPELQVSFEIISHLDKAKKMSEFKDEVNKAIGKFEETAVQIIKDLKPMLIGGAEEINEVTFERSTVRIHYVFSGTANLDMGDQIFAVGKRSGIRVERDRSVYDYNK